MLRLAKWRFDPRRALRLAVVVPTVVSLVLAPVAPVFALPQNGTVTQGTAQIVQVAPNRIDIIQSSQKVVIDWQSFNLSAGDIVNFVQANSTFAALNRVLSGSLSTISGQINAAGLVALSNSAGIRFDASALVNVGALMATTAGISNADFMAGRYNYNIASNDVAAAISNAGEINVAANGAAILAGARVENAGLIQARAGNVVLAAGKTFAVDLNGDKLLSFAVTTPVDYIPLDAQGRPVKALVENTGRINADGGRVLMTARAAKDIIDNVINTTGIVEARTASLVNGEIVFDGGDNGAVMVAGTVDASGKAAGESGGTVKALGEKVAVLDNARIDVSGDQGGGTALIGGNYQGKGPEQNATATYVGAGASIDADAITQGNGGKVIVWADQTTRFDGRISARGGQQGGNGGFVETSGKMVLRVGQDALVNVGAANGSAGTWLLDPNDIAIVAGGGASTNISGTSNFLSTDDSAQIYVNTINTALTTGNVTITTQSAGTNSQNGDITLSGGITNSSSGRSLTLTAARNINISAGGSITSSSYALNVTLDAASGAVAIGGGGIDTYGGTLTINAGNGISQTAALTSSAGAFPLIMNLSGAAAQTLTNGSNNFGSITFTKVGSATLSLTTSVTPDLQVSTLSGGSFSLTGVGFTQTGALTATGGSAVTIDGGAGGVTLSSTNSFSGNLTVQGGQITVGAAQTFNNATAKTAAFTATGQFDSNGLMTASGAGAVDYQISAGTQITVGANITSNGGNITLWGNAPGGNPNAGSNTANTKGVWVWAGANLNAGGGNIDIAGRGGNNDYNYGVYVANASTIQTTGAGTISLNGLGGTGGTTDLAGVVINSSSSISTQNGALTITGNGTSSATGNNFGIYVAGASSLSATGSGAITLTGTGGSNTNSDGIYFGSSTLSTAGAGNISITGYAQLGGGQGINIAAGGSVVALGTGRIDITSTKNIVIGSNVITYGGDILIEGNVTSWTPSYATNAPVFGTASGSFVGVNLGASVNIDAGGGNIAIAGKGGDSGFNQFGVGMGALTSVTTAGSGSITIHGYGGPSPNDNYGSGGSHTGLYFNGGASGTAAYINAVNGNIKLVGTGGGTGGGTDNNGGVAFLWAKALATGSGSIDITGVSGVGASRGTFIGLTGSEVSTVSGNIRILGTGGTVQVTGAGFINAGVQIQDGIVKSTGAGNILLNGIEGADGSGISISGTNSIGNALMTGNLTFKANSLAYSGTNTFAHQNGTGTIAFETNTNTPTIGVNGGTGTLQVSSAILGDIANFGTLVIGSGTQTGAIDTGNITLARNLTVIGGTGNTYGTIDGPYALTIAGGGGGSLGAIGGTVALTSVDTSAGANITLNGNVTTSGNQTYGGGNFNIGGGVTLNSTAGNIAFNSTLIGNANNLTVTAFGTAVLANVNSVGSLSVTSNGATTLNGSITSAGAVTFNSAIVLGADATVTTTNSNVIVSGTINGAHNFTIATGTGGVQLQGIVGGTTALSSYDSSGTTGATTIGGNITTNGAISFAGPVLLGATSTITSNGGNMAFTSNIDGPYGLTLLPGAGTLTFGGSIGASQALTAFNVTRTGAISITPDVHTGSASFTAGGAAVTLSNVLNDFTGTVSVASASNVTLAAGNSLSLGTINASGDLSISATSITQTGAIAQTGGTSASITATGAIDLSQNNSFTSNTTVNAGTTLTINAPLAVTGTASLALTAGQRVTLNDTVTSSSGDILIKGNVGSWVNPANDNFLAPGGYAGSTSGVEVYANVASSGGSIAIGGASGANTNNLYGVIVYGGNVTTTGAGSINIVGYGGTGTGNFLTGVMVQSTASPLLIQTQTGGIAITGYGGSTPGGGSIGVDINYNGAANVSIQRTAAGGNGISITGTGGPTGGSNIGVRISNGAAVATTISANDGALSITGTGGGDAGSNNHGLQIGTVTLSSSGSAITLDGTSSTTSTATGNYGAWLNGTTVSMTGASGTIDITGMASNANHDAVKIDAATTVASTGSGLITVIGSSTAGFNGGHYGISFADSVGNPVSIGGASFTGGITVQTDALNSTLANSPTAFQRQAGGGTLAFMTDTPVTSIGVNGGVGGLSLPSATLLNLKGGFSTLQIGDATQTGNIDIGGTFTPGAATLIMTAGAVAANNIVMGANALSIDQGSGFSQTGTISSSGAVDFTSTGGTGNVVANSSNTVSGTLSFTNVASFSFTNASNLTVGASDTSGNLALTASGTIGQSGALTVGGTTTLSSIGNTTLSNASNSFTGDVSATANSGGSVTLWSGSNINLGNITAGGGVTVTATSGFVSLSASKTINTSSGTGSVAITTSAGNVMLLGGSAITTGSGNITLANTTATFAGAGVDMTGASLSTTGGNIAITGVGSAGGTGDGIMFGSSSSLSAGGAGTIVLQGTAAGSGIAINSSGPTTSIATNTGALTFAGDTWSTASLLINTTSGALNIRPKSAGGTIGVAGGAGTLQITNTDIAGANAGNFSAINIGLNGFNTGAIEVGTMSMNKPLTVSGGPVTLSGVVTETAGGPVANAGITINSTGSVVLNIGAGIDTTATNGAIAITTSANIKLIASTINSGTGNITLVDGPSATPGIELTSASSLTSTGGNISLTGTGGNSGNFLYGIYVNSNSSISTTGSGTLTLSGTGGTSGGTNNSGIYVDSSTLSTQNGAINITANGAGPSGDGFLIGNSASISATGTGGISITGTSAGTGSGITATGTSSTISSTSGTLGLTSTGAINGDFALSAGSGNVAVSAGSLNLTGTVNGQTGSAAIALLTVTQTGAGPYTVNSTTVTAPVVNNQTQTQTQTALNNTPSSVLTPTTTTSSSSSTSSSSTSTAGGSFLTVTTTSGGGGSTDTSSSSSTQSFSTTSSPVDLGDGTPVGGGQQGSSSGGTSSQGNAQGNTQGNTQGTTQQGGSGTTGTGSGSSTTSGSGSSSGSGSGSSSSGKGPVGGAPAPVAKPTRATPAPVRVTVPVTAGISSVNVPPSTSTNTALGGATGFSSGGNFNR